MGGRAYRQESITLSCSRLDEKTLNSSYSGPFPHFQIVIVLRNSELLWQGMPCLKICKGSPRLLLPNLLALQGLVEFRPPDSGAVLSPSAMVLGSALRQSCRDLEILGSQPVMLKITPEGARHFRSQQFQLRQFEARSYLTHLQTHMIIDVCSSPP